MPLRDDEEALITVETPGGMLFSLTNEQWEYYQTLQAHKTEDSVKNKETTTTPLELNRKPSNQSPDDI